MRKLGKNWKRLHRLVYAAAVLAVIHYLWLVKSITAQPLVFAAIVAALLLLRAGPIKQRVLRWRRGLARKGTNTSFPGGKQTSEAGD
jgi:sulfoxide reductase heme-binding subunit YedZ